MQFQIHPPAPKRDAFHLKPQPLLERLLAGYADGSASADDTVPRQAAECAQRPDYLSRRAWKPRGRSDLAISRHFSARDLPNRVRENG